MTCTDPRDYNICTLFIDVSTKAEVHPPGGFKSRDAQFDRGAGNKIQEFHRSSIYIRVHTPISLKILSNQAGILIACLAGVHELTLPQTPEL